MSVSTSTSQVPLPSPLSPPNKSPSKNEKVTAKAHGGSIDIQGITVAKVDDQVRLQSVETWFDPLEMFRQIAPNGIVNKTIVKPKEGVSLEAQLDEEVGEGEVKDVVTASGASTAEKIEAEKKGEVAPGNAVVESGDSEETRIAHEEMGRITAAECPVFMNKE